MKKQITPLKRVWNAVASGRYGKAELLELITAAMEDEQEMFLEAWEHGNRCGWAQTSDWPETGKRYFEKKYKQHG